jgi:2-C-methyl-D-erythritol 4-phosphate cytidylyltransferase
MSDPESEPSALWAVVPAAGIGRRYGADYPKQYERLAGRAVLGWSLSALLSVPGMRGVTVPVDADDSAWQAIPECADVRVSMCRGGRERADSVRLGLEHLRLLGAADGDFVLVHDAARPGITVASIQRLLERIGESSDGGLLALPLGDTLKRSDVEQRATATEPRDGLWAAQTPQCFPLGRLLQALGAAADAGRVVTDEASAMEAIGARPRLVPGDPANLKLTRPADRDLLEAVLAARTAREEAN